MRIKEILREIDEYNNALAAIANAKYINNVRHKSKEITNINAYLDIIRKLKIL